MMRQVFLPHLSVAAGLLARASMPQPSGGGATVPPGQPAGGSPGPRHGTRRRAARQPERHPIERDAFAGVVDSLTNWQRNQWARAGYPGLRQRDPKRVRPFAELARDAARPAAAADAGLSPSGVSSLT